MNNEAFHAAMAGHRTGTIDEIAQMIVDSEHILPEEERDTNALLLEKAKVEARRAMRQFKDEDGERVYHSIVVEDDDGTKRRIYMMERYEQQVLFDYDEYAQIVNYHSERGRYHVQYAVKMQKRAAEAGHDVYLPPVFEQLAMSLEPETA
jgi:hypothetical protein